MDFNELQQSLSEAMAHAEHSIGGAMILGRSAIDSLTRIQALCQEVIVRLQATKQLSIADSSHFGDIQRKATSIEPEKVNGLDGTTEPHRGLDSSKTQQSKVQTAIHTQQTAKIGGGPIQIQESMATLQSLRATNTKLSDLLERLGNSSGNFSKPERDIAEKNFKAQPAQIVAKNAATASKGVEIAPKDTEIEQLERSNHDRPVQERNVFKDTILPQIAVNTVASAELERKGAKTGQCKPQETTKAEFSTPTVAATADPPTVVVHQAPLNTAMAPSTNRVLPIQVYLYPDVIDEQRKFEQMALTKGEVRKPLLAPTTILPTPVVNQGPTIKEPFSSGIQNRPFQLYPITTNEQRKYKQMALEKEEVDRKTFESFFRSVQNIQAVSHETPTNSSGNYLSPYQPVTVPPLPHDQPRKVSETSLDPRTPSFTPSHSRETSSTAGVDQRGNRVMLEAPFAPKVNVASETNDPEAMAVKIDRQPMASDRGALSELGTAQKQTTRATAQDSVIQHQKPPIDFALVYSSTETWQTPNDDIVDGRNRGNAGFKAAPSPAIIASMQRQQMNSKSNPAPAFSIRDAFDAFAEQQSNAPAAIPSTPAKKSINMASSSNSITQNYEIIQEPIAPDDLIDLSSNVTSPLRNVKPRVPNIANDSAAFLAAAKAAFSSFNTSRYGPTKPTKAAVVKDEEDSEQEDDSHLTDDDYVSIESPGPKRPAKITRPPSSPSTFAPVERKKQQSTPIASPIDFTAARPLPSPLEEKSKPHPAPLATNFNFTAATAAIDKIRQSMLHPPPTITTTTTTPLTPPSPLPILPPALATTTNHPPPPLPTQRPHPTQLTYNSAATSAAAAARKAAQKLATGHVYIPPHPAMPPAMNPYDDWAVDLHVVHPNRLDGKCGMPVYWKRVVAGEGRGRDWYVLEGSDPGGWV